MAEETIETTAQATEPQQSAETTQEQFFELVDKFSVDDTVLGKLQERFNPLNDLDSSEKIGKFINSNRSLASFVDSNKTRFHNEQIERQKDSLYNKWHLERNPESDPTTARIQQLEDKMARKDLAYYAIQKATRNGLTEEDAEKWISPIAKSKDDVDNLVDAMKSRLQINEKSIRDAEQSRILKTNSLDLPDSKEEDGKPKFTRAQLQKWSKNPEEWKLHSEEIKLAEKEGRII